MVTGHPGKRFVVPAALAVIGAAMAGALDNGFVNWDDGVYIVNNPLVTAAGDQSLSDRVTTPGLGYALPIPILVYGWLWSLGGEAWPFHAFGVAIHVINAALMIALLRRSGVSEGVAAAAAVAFGVHPLVVEPTVWATGLKDLLVGTGTLLAMHGFVRGATGTWAIPAALLAFGSKPTSILLAAPLWAMQWVRPREEEGTRRATIAPLVAVAAMGIGLGWFTMAQESVALRTSSPEPFSLGRVFGALGTQVQHIVAPGTLAPRYDASLAGPIEVVLGVVATAGVAWLSLRWASRRDPRLPWLVMGIAAYVPVSNLRPLERFTADSYIYLPWMALVACVAMTWPSIESALQDRGGRMLRLVRGFVILACVAWAGLTTVQIEVWSDSRALWRDSYLAHPDDPETIYRYGDALGRAGEVRKELSIYLEHESDLERGQRIPVVLPHYFERTGDPDRAAAWYDRAFSSPVEQDAGMYWQYVEFVGRFPRQHHPRHDEALRYAMRLYLQQRGVDRLDETQRANLSKHARGLGLGPNAF